MSIELCILASGSSGNAAVLRTPSGVMLIDAGVGPRTCAKRLDGTGVSLSHVQAICLTHLDRDHFSTTWIKTIIDQRIRLYCHATRVQDVLAIARYWEQTTADPGAGRARQFAELIHTFDGSPFSPLPGLHLRPLAFEHDEEGSHGFVADGHGGRIGYATDLGRVPDCLIDQFCDADVLALESNYDPQMELNSPRPWFLKQRIMGGHGHLSNAQAYDAICRILDRCKRVPTHIVLLHRSRQCNCPNLVRQLFTQDPRIAPRLTLAEQYQRTDWLRITRTPALPGEQLALTWE